MQAERYNPRTYCGKSKEISHKMTLKESTIVVLLVASGVLNAYLWQRLIFAGSYSDLWLFLLPLLALFLFAAFFSLLALLGQSPTVGSLAVLASFVGSFFFVKASSVVLVGLILTLAASLWALRAILLEVKSGSIFRLSKILRQGLPLFFTAVSLLISVFYFASLTETGATTVLPRAIFDLSLPYTEGALQGLLPGFKSTLSIEELLMKTVESQLASEGVNVSSLPREQIEKLLKSQRSALERALGASLPEKGNAADLLYDLTNSRVENLLGSYKSYVPYISAIGFFLTIKILSVPLYLISLGFVWVLLQLLLAIGVVRWETVNVEVKRISL